MTRPVAVDPDDEPRARGRAPRLGTDFAAPVESRPSMIKKFIRRVLGSASETSAARAARKARPRPRGPQSRRRPRCAPRCARRASPPTSSAARCATCCSASTPKDFDIATDATPEQVKPLFRRAAHHRPALPPRARDVRPRDGRGLDLPRAPTPTTSREATSTAACCATTSSARRTRTRCAATSRSTRCTTIRPPRRSVDYHGGIDDLEEARAAHDRRSGDALSRGSGAHAARGAPRREARPRRSTRRRARRSASWRRCWSNVPPARLFDEMLKLLLSGHAARCLRQSARSRPAPRPAAAARRDPRAAARRALRRRWRSRRPTSACSPSKAGLARVPVRRAAVARGARGVEGARRRAASGRCRRCSRRDGRGARHAGAKLAIPRSSTATMNEIWAMQPRFEQRSGSRAVSPARSSALSRRLRFPRAARRERRGAGRARAVVARFQGADARDAQGDAAARDRRRASARRRRRKKRARGARRARPRPA